ncbi:MAG: NADH-quinone oxidoreductase subunit L [Alphaproteobacteria bacterium CG_4_10_14_0_8_um_filter_53_9]|nr:MAG: NADH-quinone oxidoreductase subunit L [Alphaproteobacteria bacterium CG_4_10_14_0_8_um_filter_53_9]
MQNLTTLATLLPLAGALFAAVWVYLFAPRTILSYNANSNAAQIFTTGSVLVAAALSWVIFLTAPNGETHTWFTWIALSDWQITFGTVTDKLSSTMLIVVTTVSACVHVYSWGYMKEDGSRPRFFIYLSLFTFAMLMLVTAPNMVQMFLGWEGVGVCSYLLIGFWHHKATANAAAMKAFIVNRVADAAMLIGLFMLLQSFGSLTYADMFAQAPNTHAAGPENLSLALLLIFIGAMGKSAQFGLHTWLPDAMEGPTPVSALIHAATMVTAGVFLLCRLSPLYEYAPSVLHIVAWVGALTAIFAATVGLTQKDIKRVIAYSTCSQLGYMFFAIGVSAYPAAMFHLTTHAFFKALLFLGAGSVIHGMHHEQNLFKMGGIKKALPITYGLMWVGSLALAGIPPFAGFFSKDLVLESAFGAHTFQGTAIYVVGTIAALLTAIYSFRVIFRAFHGEAPHEDGHHHHTPHESPWSMLAPMVPLALGAVAAGFLLKNMGTLEWWQGAIVISEHHPALENAHHTPFLIKYLPLVLAAGGIAAAYYAFASKAGQGAMHRLAIRLRPLYLISYNKWYVDEIYDALIVKPTRILATAAYIVGDKLMIDHILVNGSARTVGAAAKRLRQIQSGKLETYTLLTILGLVLLLAFTIWSSL